jgi:hypothetical protein
MVDQPKKPGQDANKQAAPQQSRAEQNADAELDLIEQEQRRQEAERVQAEEAKEAKRQDQRKLAQKIFDAGAEGVEVKDGKDQDAIDEMVRDGHAHIETVQSGPGGLEVKRYAYLTAQGEGFR